MATRLAKMPAKKGHHPWADWTDGSAWLIKRGEDFPGKVESMRVRLYSKARELGKDLQIVVDKEAGTIAFRMYDPE